MKFKYGIFILFFSINCFAHHPGNQIDADKPYPSINLTVIKDEIDGYNIFIDLKNFNFDVIRLSSTSNKVLHFKHFSNILFNLNNLLLYNKKYVFPNN